MQAIAVTPDHNVRLVERPEPPFTAPDLDKLEVLRVGICGTDRDEVVRRGCDRCRPCAMGRADMCRTGQIPRARTRLPDAGATPAWLVGRRCLVAGLGPVGLLAAMTLRLRDAEVYGLNVVDAQSVRPEWLRRSR